MITFTAGYELENEKMIEAGLKLTVKDHITVGLWLVPAVSWRPVITIGSSQEPTVISLQHKKAAAVLSFLLSSIPRTEARVWTLPSIIAVALHHEASAWILKNGLIFLL